ncbi:MarR family transcriptional regulator [Streptomyces sp. NPDC025273]|uniref:MarR family winged helix-turn-helix transcriptional regulator n=1 Tax=unclassified Streptomyces TaxID=2593676 RepID=UPI0033E998D5
MREDPSAFHPRAPDAHPEVTQALELLEIAWERGRDVLTTAPVSTAQTRVMYIIQREPGINLSTLRHHLSIAAPSVTRLCDRLQAAGFLRRVPRPEDRREIQLELTDAGSAHLREIRRRREYALSQAMSRMTPDDRQALVTGLSALSDAVSEPLQPLHERTA